MAKISKVMKWLRIRGNDSARKPERYMVISLAFGGGDALALTNEGSMDETLGFLRWGPGFSTDTLLNRPGDLWVAYDGYEALSSEALMFSRGGHFLADPNQVHATEPLMERFKDFLRASKRLRT